MNMHVAAPATVEAPPTPATMVQDWERLVSPGHTMRERLMQGAKGKFARALAALIGAAVVTAYGVEIARIQSQTSFAALFLVNPQTYADFGEDGRGSYRLAWLADLPAQGGMSATAFDDLVTAVRSDVGAFGNDAASWQSTAELGIAPRITRPNRMFEAETIDRLSTGTVGVPAQGFSTVEIVAFVDGRLRWVSVSGRSDCAVFFGPVRDGCQTLRPTRDPVITEHVAELRPAPVQE